MTLKAHIYMYIIKKITQRGKMKKYSLNHAMKEFLHESGATYDISAVEKDLNQMAFMGSARKGKRLVQRLAGGSIRKSEYKQLCLAALGILQRESGSGQGRRYRASNWIEELYNESEPGWFKSLARWAQGIDDPDHVATTGPAQISFKQHIENNPQLKKYADAIGVKSQNDLSGAQGFTKSGLAALGILAKNYIKAKKVGYQPDKPSVPGETDAYDLEKWLETRDLKEFKGTGNAALDIALTGYNAGIGKVKNYGKSSPNYLPCWGDGCVSGSSDDVSTLGYVAFIGRFMRNNQHLLSFYEKEVVEPPTPKTTEDPSSKTAEDDIQIQGPPGPEAPIKKLTISSRDIFGSGSSWDQSKWEDFIEQGIEAGFIEQAIGKTAKSSWKKASKKLGYDKASIGTAKKYYNKIKKQFDDALVTETYRFWQKVILS